MFVEPQPTSEEPHPEDEWTVGQNKTEHSDLDVPQFALNQGKDSDHRFDDVAERGVEQAAQSLANTESEHLGCKSGECGKWDDSLEAGYEDNGWVLVRPVLREDIRVSFILRDVGGGRRGNRSGRGDSAKRRTEVVE